MGKVDYDRGVMKGKDPTSGIEVYMYMDTPGVYLNAFEQPVSEKLALAAGFDVDKFRSARQRQERMAYAKQQIEKELAHGIPQKEPLLERKGWKIMVLGKNLHNVVDPDGNVLNQFPLGEEVARSVFDSLIPPEAVQKAPEGKKEEVVTKAASSFGAQQKSKE